MLVHESQHGHMSQLDPDGEPVYPSDFSLSSSKADEKLQVSRPPALPSTTLQLCQSKEGLWPKKDNSY